MLLLLNFTILSGGTLIIPILCILLKFFHRSPTPKRLPWLYHKRGSLAQLLERFRGIDPTPFIKDGYARYSKSNKAFIMPSIHEGDEVLLPKDHSTFIHHANENDLSFKAHVMDFFQSKYTSQPWAYHENYENFVKLIGNDLTRSLESSAVADAITQEARAALAECWGQNTEEWTDVVLYRTLERIACRVVNVLAVGPELSHDETYLDAMIKCTQQILIGSNIIRIFPDFLRPIVGPVVGLANRWFERAFEKRLEPLVHTRLREHVRGIGKKEDSEKPKIKSNLLDICIDAAFRGTSAVERTPNRLMYRMFMLNFPAVHTTSISACNFFLDLLSCAPEKRAVECLEDEVRRIWDTCNGDTWTVGDVRKASLMDSAVKESLRMHGLNAIGSSRRVTSSSGLTLPDGTKVPHGTNVGLPLLAIHLDEEYYPNPLAYDPFRFAPSPDADDKNDKQRSSLTTTSETYLAFGHGRRPCVGRFIFQHIMKVLAAEVFLNYDLKPVERRPKISWFGRFQLPVRKATVTIRRKKGTEIVTQG